MAVELHFLNILTSLHVFDQKALGILEKLNAQSCLTFKSADFPYLEGIRPANVNRP